MAKATVTIVGESGWNASGWHSEQSHLPQAVRAIRTAELTYGSIRTMRLRECA